MRLFEIASSEQDIVIYDDNYPSLKDLLNGLHNGKLLVHTRVPDGTNFEYGIDPSAGDFLRSTEAWQTAEELHGSGPELTFFSDSLTWSQSSNFLSIKKTKKLELIFVEKNKTIQQSLGNGMVKLASGKTVPYDRSPMADYEDPLFKDEPAGVETSDWYTNKSQDVVAVVQSAALLSV